MRGGSCVSRKMSTCLFFFFLLIFWTLSSSGCWSQKVRIIKGEMLKLYVNLQKVSVGTHEGGAHRCSTFTIQMFLVMHHQSHFHTLQRSFILLHPWQTLLSWRPDGQPPCQLIVLSHGRWTPSGLTRYCWELQGPIGNQTDYAMLRAMPAKICLPKTFRVKSRLRMNICTFYLIRFVTASLASAVASCLSSLTLSIFLTNLQKKSLHWSLARQIL